MLLLLMLFLLINTVEATVVSLNHYGAKPLMEKSTINIKTQKNVALASAKKRIQLSNVKNLRLLHNERSIAKKINRENLQTDAAQHNPQKKPSIETKTTIIPKVNTNSSSTASSVTYTLSGGRFGDNLISYCHARWIAYKYQLKFLYLPFPYSNELKMHRTHKIYKKEQSSHFSNIIDFSTASFVPEPFDIAKNSSNLYIIPYFSESQFEVSEKHNGYFAKRFHFDVNWDDQKFLKIIRREISSIKSLPEFSLPKKGIRVAVHFRYGSGGDHVFQNTPSNEDVWWSDRMLPHKHVSSHFYIESIKIIRNTYKDVPLYVYLFTDCTEPKKLLDHIKKEVQDSSITYACKESDNASTLDPDKSILEDFFAITKFDCLIRPESHYSMVAEQLGNFKMIIAPSQVQWQDQKVVVTEKKIKTRKYSSRGVEQRVRYVKSSGS